MKRENKKQIVIALTGLAILIVLLIAITTAVTEFVLEKNKTQQEAIEEYEKTEAIFPQKEPTERQAT